MLDKETILFELRCSDLIICSSDNVIVTFNYKFRYTNMSEISYLLEWLMLRVPKHT